MHRIIIFSLLLFMVLSAVPLVHADNTNLLPMNPSGLVTYPAPYSGYYWDACDGGWALFYTSNTPQLISVDTSVTHNGDASIRLDPVNASTAYNSARECDSANAFSVVGGDNIYCSCYVKVSDSPMGDANDYGGGRIGFDFYGLDTVTNQETYISLSESQCESIYSWNDNYNWVPFGSDWTYQSINVTCPSFIIDASTGDNVTVNSIICWVQVMGSYNDGTAYAHYDYAIGWFADSQLIINGSPSPTPSPTPTPSWSPAPSPTPSPSTSGDFPQTSLGPSPSPIINLPSGGDMGSMLEAVGVVLVPAGACWFLFGRSVFGMFLGLGIGSGLGYVAGYVPLWFVVLVAFGEIAYIVIPHINNSQGAE